MPLALNPSTVAGCSISLLFSTLAFAWTTLMSGRDPPMEVKQLILFLIIVVDSTILIGYREGNSEVSCQIITVIISYMMIASFVATFLDHYYNYLSVCKRRSGIGFIKTQTSGILLPMVSIPIIILIGVYSNQRNSRESYLLCWNVNAVVGFTSGIASIFTVASLVLCFGTIRAATQKCKIDDGEKAIRKYRFSRYNIGVSFFMTLLTCIVWFSASLFSWHPSHKTVHLVFSLAISIQGIFGFFFYCVLALELGIFDESFPRIRSIVEKGRAHQIKIQKKIIKENAEPFEVTDTTAMENSSSHFSYGCDLDCSLNNLSAAQNEIEDEYSQKILETPSAEISSAIPLSSSVSFSKLSNIHSPVEVVSPETLIHESNKSKQLEVMRMKPSSTGLPNMNELEALFNNPEMIASYGKVRKNSGISTSKVSVDVP